MSNIEDEIRSFVADSLHEFFDSMDFKKMIAESFKETILEVLEEYASSQEKTHE